MPNPVTSDQKLISAPFVLASDVHIQHMSDERSTLLLDVLDRLSPDVETLVLNGDICDFCFGASSYFRRKFQSLGAALEGLVNRGIRVYFVEGNHEFHLERIGWEGVQIVQSRDLVVALESGHRIKLMHGDLLIDEPLYRAFRATLKSQFVRRTAALLPGAGLDAYALRHAKFSRAQDRYRVLDHARILKAFSDWLAQDEAHHGIIGHFHVPYAEKHPQSDRMMVSVDSWDKPNLLVFAAGQFSRVYLSEPGAPFVATPAQSIFSETK
jgi:UDP-2,3-diacylglucosamine pyrophosphatase LpxH